MYHTILIYYRCEKPLPLGLRVERSNADPAECKIWLQAVSLSDANAKSVETINDIKYHGEARGLDIEVSAITYELHQVCMEVC